MSEMRTFRLEKLVHDEIVQGHIDEGGIVDFEVLEGEALSQGLERKIKEEQGELRTSRTDEAKLKEQEDINNVLFALGRLAGDTFRPTKTFSKGHYIHTVTMPAKSWLTKYYADNPDRFPEVV